MQDVEGGLRGEGGEFIKGNRAAMTSFAVVELKAKGCSDPEGHAGTVVDRVCRELEANWERLRSPHGAMFRLTSFRARDHARTCRREVASDIDVGAVPLYGKPDRGPEEYAAEAEFVERALSFLNEEEQVVVELKLFEELTFDAIAVRLSKPPKTVSSTYYRALKKIKEGLGGAADAP